MKIKAPKFKINFIVSAFTCAMAIQTSYAQSPPTTADVLRNIEQNKINLIRTARNPEEKQTKPSTVPDQGFARLKEIQVNSPLFQQELMDYWTSEINQPVSAQKLSDFKAFAWNLFQRKGYLVYITIDTTSTTEGSVLKVTASFPHIGKIFVVATNGDKGKEFSEEVAHRFNAAYKTGMPVDVQGFENQLNAAAYDLPVDLELSMRQVSSTVVDLVIHLRLIETQTGKVLGGLLQANNHGLEQFGREQVLGNLRIAGFTPQSELTLTTQQSVGVGYYRADYEAPIIGTGLRWKIYAGEVNTQAVTNNGFSQETGAGLTQLLRTDRAGRWLAGAEISQRETRNWTAGIMTADRMDQQLKLRLRSESTKEWVNNFSNELTFTTGRMNLDRFPSDQAYDASHQKVAGTYQKLEMNGALSQVLGKDRIYTGSIRWRTQVAAKNLDSYNKISLGGVSGMRSYSTIDGVGDQGAQLSFDIIHQVVPDVWGGVFYDIGAVKSDRRPLAAATNAPSYLLQGAGAQFGGTISQFQWTLSMAVALGKKPSTWTAANTAPGDMRINFAVTRPF